LFHLVASNDYVACYTEQRLRCLGFIAMQLTAWSLDLGGSCGTAAFSKKLANCSTHYTHPWWEPFATAERAGLKPRRAHSHRVSSAALCTFAIYHRMISTPTAHDIAVIENEARLIALAIDSMNPKRIYNWPPAFF